VHPPAVGADVRRLQAVIETLKADKLALSIENQSLRRERDQARAELGTVVRAATPPPPQPPPPPPEKSKALLQAEAASAQLRTQVLELQQQFAGAERRWRTTEQQLVESLHERAALEQCLASISHCFAEAGTGEHADPTAPSSASSKSAMLVETHVMVHNQAKARRCIQEHREEAQQLERRIQELGEEVERERQANAALENQVRDRSRQVADLESTIETLRREQAAVQEENQQSQQDLVEIQDALQRAVAIQRARTHRFEDICSFLNSAAQSKVEQALDQMSMAIEDVSAQDQKLLKLVQRAGDQEALLAKAEIDELTRTLFQLRNAKDLAEAEAERLRGKVREIDVAKNTEKGGGQQQQQPTTTERDLEVEEDAAGIGSALLSIASSNEAQSSEGSSEKR